MRADEVRRDELGDLADSINIMIESLLRRDRIMESVRFAGQKLMLIDSWADAINDILAKIGQATDASRAYFFENRLDDDDRLLCSLRYEWTAQGICARLPSPRSTRCCVFVLCFGSLDRAALLRSNHLRSDFRLEPCGTVCPGGSKHPVDYRGSCIFRGDMAGISGIGRL